MSKVKFDLWVSQRENETNEKYLDLIINRDYSNPQRPIVRMWRGKQSRPFYNFYHRNIEQAETNISKYKSNSEAKVKRVEEEKANKKQAMSNFKSTMTAGTILTCSWGYDQTNVDFYEVLEVKGMFATIQEIGQDCVETGFMCGETKPNRASKIGKPMRKKICVRVYGDKVNESIKLSECQRLNIWDGHLKYSSWYA